MFQWTCLWGALKTERSASGEDSLSAQLCPAALWPPRAGGAAVVSAPGREVAPEECFWT